MGRLLHKFVAGTALLSAGVVAGTGCADNESSLFIVGVTIPEPPECVARPSATAILRGRGVVDFGLRSDYSAWLLLGNQLTPRGVKNQLRAETGRIRIKGAVVQIADDVGNELEEFTVPSTGFVSVVRSEEAAFGVSLTTLIPASVTPRLVAPLQDSPFASRTLVLTVRVFGDTTGGLEVESADFVYVVDACIGCLVDYRFADATLDPVACVASTEADTQAPCVLGQDALVDCRLCTGNPLCATPPTFN